jgi:hypothetical protein
VSADGFYYFLLVQKVTKKDTTPKDTAILLSHALTTLIAMQIPIAIGIVSAPGVDYPRMLTHEKL